MMTGVPGRFGNLKQIKVIFYARDWSLDFLKYNYHVLFEISYLNWDLLTNTGTLTSSSPSSVGTFSLSQVVATPYN